MREVSYSAEVVVRTTVYGKAILPDGYDTDDLFDAMENNLPTEIEFLPHEIEIKDVTPFNDHQAIQEE